MQLVLWCFKDANKIMDPAGPSSDESFTEQELDEVRTILSDLLSDLFASKKGILYWIF